MKSYKLCDVPNRHDREKLGVDRPDGQWWRYEKCGELVQVRGILTGEKRQPCAGEWYLSGAIPEAYRAPSDLSSVYHIVKLVAMRRTKPEWEVVS